MQAVATVSRTRFAAQIARRAVGQALSFGLPSRAILTGMKRRHVPGLPLWALVSIAACLGLAGGFALPPWPAIGGPPNATNARVIDGDTLDVAGERIRLLGLDAPEGKQVCQRDGRPWQCGDDATAALRGLMAGRPVHCDVKGRDRYQRALAVCTAGGTDLAREMVRRGMAVAYYPSRGVRGPSYDAEEADAEAAQRGLWGGSFVRPSEWRQGEC